MIKRKLKICAGCGKEKYLYAKKMCQYCYMKSKQKKEKNEVADEGGEERSMMALFNEIWKERLHKSEIDGTDLLPKGHKLWHWQFSHLLPKGLYKKSKFDKENIVLKTVQQHQDWQFHIQKLRGKEEWKWVFEKYEALKEAYNNG